MKTLLLSCLLAAASLTTTVWAADATVVTGQVLEIKEVDSYTYLRLKTKEGETWAAVSKVSVKKGATVTIENVMVMNNFESKSLKQTFPTILFGNLGGGAKMPEAGPIKVPKASGANAMTVAEIVAQATELKDKPVRVRGKIVKYNPEVMGKNWLHLRDGSGSDAAGTNDILVTTTAPAKLGDVVTVSGVVHTNKDFGAGYAYKVLIEEATLSLQKAN
jgi:hypothetical protein